MTVRRLEVHRQEPGAAGAHKEVDQPVWCRPNLQAAAFRCNTMFGAAGLVFLAVAGHGGLDPLLFLTRGEAFYIRGLSHQRVDSAVLTGPRPAVMRRAPPTMPRRRLGCPVVDPPPLISMPVYCSEPPISFSTPSLPGSNMNSRSDSALYRSYFCWFFSSYLPPTESADMIFH